MGYTHYFEVRMGTTMSPFKLLATKTKRLIRAAEKRGIKVAYDRDYPHTPPLVSPDVIMFNGIGEDGHETFILDRVTAGREFCKTDRKPYDLLVASVLLLASKQLKGFKLNSDGFNEDGTVDDEWKRAQTFVYTVLGNDISMNRR